MDSVRKGRIKIVAAEPETFSDVNRGGVYRVHKERPYERPRLVVLTTSEVEIFWKLRVHKLFLPKLSEMVAVIDIHVLVNAILVKAN